ncbi:MAG: hypothetical protein KKB02_06295 [Alphaproteobacteria bacterium]|nr:hypothetical protein [Alphaproteobacteria bacterium]
MISKTRLSLVAIALGALTACGGTTVPLPAPGGNVSPGDNLLPSGGSGRLSLREIGTISDRLAPGYNAAGITPKASVPISGGANYLGYVAGNLSAANLNSGWPVGLNGVTEMGVDFGTRRVAGTVGNFVTETGNQIEGTLNVNGTLDRAVNPSQVTIRGDVNGVINGGTVGVNGTITDNNGRAGGFKGNSGQYIGLPMRGSINANGTPGTFALDGVLGRTSR